MQSTNETEREGHLSMLTMLKELRETIDEHISNLLEETEEEKIKKYVTNTMRGFIIDIGQKYKDCLDENCPTSSPECDSCGAEKVKLFLILTLIIIIITITIIIMIMPFLLGGRDEGEDEAVQEQLEQPEGGGRQEGLHQVGSFLSHFISLFLCYFFVSCLTSSGRT